MVALGVNDIDEMCLEGFHDGSFVGRERDLECPRNF